VGMKKYERFLRSIVMGAVGDRDVMTRQPLGQRLAVDLKTRGPGAIGQVGPRWRVVQYGRGDEDGVVYGVALTELQNDKPGKTINLNIYINLRLISYQLPRAFTLLDYSVNMVLDSWNRFRDLKQGQRQITKAGNEVKERRTSTTDIHG
jgi:hypothetical protein